MSASKEYTALVTDDNFHNRDIFRALLENAAFKVSLAESGQLCLDLLEKQTFDLLVLDLSMPGMSGIEVLNQIRANSRHKDMRIIVATAEPRMVTQLVDDLADFVVIKPFGVAEIQQLVERIKDTP